MNAHQRARYAEAIDKEFQPGDQVAIDDHKLQGVWSVQHRYSGQKYNTVQVLHNFFKVRQDVPWLHVKSL